MAAKKILINKIKNLDPTEFENLVFDLIILSGLNNVSWRTPGADGGRDIEGIWIKNDFSGSLKVERWYVECKRYNNSIDWPTIYNKIAYADNHNADFLLIVTTAILSPRCKDEVEKWGKDNRKPIVRYWDGTKLEEHILRHPILLQKYIHGFEKDGKKATINFLPAINILLKAISGAYSKAVFTDTLSTELELCASLVDLISARLIDSHESIEPNHKRFIIERDLYSWCSIESGIDLSNLDSFGLRVLLSLIKFCEKNNEIEIKQSKDGICEMSITKSSNSEIFNTVSQLVHIHSNIQFNYTETKLIVNIRK